MHPATGELDVAAAYPEWNPSKHYLVTVMTYLKRIFFVRNYDDRLMSEEEMANIPNQEALQLFTTDPEGYRRRVQECVKESQRSVYLNEPGCTIHFSRENEECHDRLMSMLKERFGGEGGDDDAAAAGDGRSSSADDAHDESRAVVTRDATLDIIREVVRQQQQQQQQYYHANGES